MKSALLSYGIAWSFYGWLDLGYGAFILLRSGHSRRQVAASWLGNSSQLLFFSCVMPNFMRKNCRWDQISSLWADARIQTCLNSCVRSRGQNDTNFQCRLVRTVPCALSPRHTIKKLTNGKASFIHIYVLEGVSFFCIEGLIMLTSSINLL